jgi:hypothetical protein
MRGGDFLHVFLPTFFIPSIEIFPIPTECPDEVTKEIKESFNLFWTDPPASANHIRKCIEEILTDKGVKRFGTNKKRKQYPIMLHDRIIIFGAHTIRKKEVAEKLKAIKLLGNTGSHSDILLTTDDLLDAYEILETVLDDLYVGHAQEIKRKVIALNKTKRPIKRNNR